MNLLMRLVDTEGKPLGPFEQMWMPFEYGKALRVRRVTGRKGRFSLAWDAVRGRDRQPLNLGEPIIHASRAGSWNGILEVWWPNYFPAGRVGVKSAIKCLLAGDSVCITTCDITLNPFTDDRVPQEKP